MTGECRYCGCEKVVPVLDKRIEQSPKAGNKFRTACIGCNRWLPMTSEEVFRSHDRPHVLPLEGVPKLSSDEDPDVEDVVPLEDYDYGPELADLVERISGDGGQTAATDGGQDVPETGDDDVEDELEDDDEEAENRFQCPATNCDAVHVGHPDECTDPVEGEGCGIGYNW